jgi:hypothetical protein
MLARIASAVAVACLLVLPGSLAAADNDIEPVLDTHQDLVSGGSVLPDTAGTAMGPSSPTGTGKPPRVGPNVRVNAPQQGFPNGLFGRSETTVAASDDGQLLTAGFNDAQGFCGPPFGVACTPPPSPGLSGFAFSSDSGMTWTDTGPPPVIDHVFTRGDPWLDRGGFDNSTFYYANLAVDDRTGNSLGASVHRGHFSGGGFSFQDVHVLAPPNPADSYDKEAIAAAKDGSGTAYVSLTNFVALPCPKFPNVAGAFGQIEVWRTHDAGDTWQGPTVVSPDKTSANPADPNCGNFGVLQQSSVPAIGPDGAVYVTWQFGPTFGANGTSTGAEIRVARSLDGGVTFGPPATVAVINSMRQDAPVGYNRNRINDHPRVSVATSGRNRGRVYVSFYSAVSPVGPAPVGTCPAGTPKGTVCVGQNVVSSQAFVAFSDDGGSTWNTPQAVAPTPPATGTKRIWPVVSVEPGGRVNVVYYESQDRHTSADPNAIECNIGLGGVLRRVGTASSRVDTFWAQSDDGGATFSTPLKVTSATTNWCTTVSNIRPNFGDYIGSTSGGNRAMAAWADGRNGVPDAFYATVFGHSKS